MCRQGVTLDETGLRVTTYHDIKKAIRVNRPNDDTMSMLSTNSKQEDKSKAQEDESDAEVEPPDSLKPVIEAVKSQSAAVPWPPPEPSLQSETVSSATMHRSMSFPQGPGESDYHSTVGHNSVHSAALMYPNVRIQNAGPKREILSRHLSDPSNLGGHQGQGQACTQQGQRQIKGQQGQGHRKGQQGQKSPEAKMAENQSGRGSDFHAHAQPAGANGRRHSYVRHNSRENYCQQRECSFFLTFCLLGFLA